MADKKEKNEWDNREIGALWVNAKPGGDKYLTGHINKEKVIVFKNKFKEDNEKAPDFRVYKQTELGAPKESSEPKVEKEEEEDVDLI